MNRNGSGEQQWFSRLSEKFTESSAGRFVETEERHRQQKKKKANIFSRLSSYLAARRDRHMFMMMLTSDERSFFQLYRYALYYVRPPLAVQYTAASHPCRHALRRVVRSRALELFQSALAILHVLAMSSMNWVQTPRAGTDVYLAKEADAVMTASMRGYVIGDACCTAVFVAVMLAKMYVYGFFPYVAQRRNWVDIAINAATVTGCVFCLAAPGSAFWTATPRSSFYASVPNSLHLLRASAPSCAASSYDGLNPKLLCRPLHHSAAPRRLLLRWAGALCEGTIHRLPSLQPMGRV